MPGPWVTPQPREHHGCSYKGSGSMLLKIQEVLIRSPKFGIWLIQSLKTISLWVYLKNLVITLVVQSNVAKIFGWNDVVSHVQQKVFQLSHELFWSTKVATYSDEAYLSCGQMGCGMGYTIYGIRYTVYGILCMHGCLLYTTYIVSLTEKKYTYTSPLNFA